MKEIKELKFEELTVRQKLGMTIVPALHEKAANDEFVFNMIKERAVGAVWIQQGGNEVEEQIKKVREAADYPILIITDAESGIGEYLVGKHNAIGTAGSTKHAYAFGKAVGVTARKMGYNVVCDPVVDMNAGSMRSLGTDKEKVAELSAAIAKGMHDGGVLTVAKHYPGGKAISEIDAHMAESTSADTKEMLLDYAIYPYQKLWEAGLLDGVMTRHQRFINIDDKHPASLSKAVIDIIRDNGYEGFAITDALCMLGIRAKFGDVEAKGIAVNAGNDLLLPYSAKNREQFEQYEEAYNRGLVDTEALDAAVKRVLAAQHKTMLLPTDTEISDEENATFMNINKDGVYAKTDEGVPVTISRDGKHYFIIVAKQETDIRGGKIDVDTFSNGWHKPERIVKKIEELFPNAQYKIIHEFPSPGEMFSSLTNSLGCEELVIMTFTEALASTGPEFLTHRIVNLINAMQVTDRISTLIHLGNPYVLEELPHIKRVIFGGHAIDSIETTLEVLAGEYTANGVPTYDFKLQ